MNLCIITPCGTEDETIENHIKNLHNELKKIPECTFAVCYIVDNYTSDATRKILNDYAEKLEYMHIHEKPENRKGLAGCYIAGYELFLENTDCDYILEMDIESHPYEEVKNFIAEAKSGYDIVLGSRNLKNGKNKSSLKRRIISSLGSFIDAAILIK